MLNCSGLMVPQKRSIESDRAITPVATVPEPATLQGYQAVDALNRAFQGEKPVDFQQPVYLVVKQNVDKEGGDKNLYDPSNNYRERYLKIWKPE